MKQKKLSELAFEFDITEKNDYFEFDNALSDDMKNDSTRKKYPEHVMAICNEQFKVIKRMLKKQPPRRKK